MSDRAPSAAEPDGVYAEWKPLLELLGLTTASMRTWRTPWVLLPLATVLAKVEERCGLSALLEAVVGRYREVTRALWRAMLEWIHFPFALDGRELDGLTLIVLLVGGSEFARLAGSRQSLSDYYAALQKLEPAPHRVGWVIPFAVIVALVEIFVLPNVCELAVANTDVFAVLMICVGLGIAMAIGVFLHVRRREGRHGARFLPTAIFGAAAYVALLGFVRVDHDGDVRIPTTVFAGLLILLSFGVYSFAEAWRPAFKAVLYAVLIWAADAACRLIAPALDVITNVVENAA